ncbi:DNA cytosine methyltransferase [Nostoc sp. ChiQUE01b]|uniref:DNA cytosine methyltransferase n=1 Tax=Nostoc sp. ChiQUE01b TaxID=3075376 RepID=UPI002AD406D8|nr:DNA cytosine methyltransferase [Nostoc sp. ChiQUE01b]MDZ8261947.1 DNA cytosine methyltransferase [Nostoc sp. ChiQUE01b]
MQRLICTLDTWRQSHEICSLTFLRHRRTGFPCAGTSGAGDRQGLLDTRSFLWREMFRIIRPNLGLALC